VADLQNILFLYSAASVPEEILQAAETRVPEGFSLTRCERSTSDALRRKLVSEADYVLLYGLRFDDLEVAANARLLQLLSAGYDRLDLDAFSKAGIPVANNGGANGPTVAEHAVLLMLAVFKKLPLHHNALHQGKWLGLSEGLRMRELRGKRVGIVGFGHIGREVARMVRGFLATVAYADVQRAPTEIEQALEAEHTTLGELLETSDVVTIHTPLNAATREMIDERVLARMKRSAILINTSRGPVVNQTHLAEALRTGVIAGAGLDVFDPEPLAADSPLLAMDNVVVTPHIAGTTIDTWSRRLDFAFANIERVARGEKAEALVG
jgi:phosphoglycerate dehydrogenase-like enzyme